MTTTSSPQTMLQLSPSSSAAAHTYRSALASSSAKTITLAPCKRSIFLKRVPSVSRATASSMAAYKPNTEPPKTVAIFRNMYQVASGNDKFRRVLWTGRSSQLVIMTVPVGGEVGEETHSVDQHLNFLSGTGQAIIDGTRKESVNPGDIVIVPAGTLHNFKNTGPTPLIVSTVYAPAEHKADTVHDTLEQGEQLEDEGKDEPPSWAQDLHKKP